MLCHPILIEKHCKYSAGFQWKSTCGDGDATNQCEWMCQGSASDRADYWCVYLWAGNTGTVAKNPEEIGAKFPLGISYALAGFRV